MAKAVFEGKIIVFLVNFGFKEAVALYVENKGVASWCRRGESNPHGIAPAGF